MNMNNRSSFLLLLPGMYLNKTSSTKAPLSFFCLPKIRTLAKGGETKRAFLLLLLTLLLLDWIASFTHSSQELASNSSSRQFPLSPLFEQKRAMHHAPPPLPSSPSSRAFPSSLCYIRSGVQSALSQSYRVSADWLAPIECSL